MSVTITVKLGDDFFIGDHRYILQEITQTKGGYTAEIVGDDLWGYTVSIDEWVDILKGVQFKLSTKRPSHFSEAKIMIEAPAYKVLRGVLYRQGDKG